MGQDRTKEQGLRMLWKKHAAQGGEWLVWLSVQGSREALSRASMQRSSDCETNTAQPSEQGPLWKSGV